MFGLKVSEEQQRFVASNLSSVASCYVLSINGSMPLPFCIYAEDLLVGFVMIVYGITGYEEPDIASGNYCVLRLMIDARYQGRGYGRAAMQKVIEYVKTYPAGPAEYLWISYAPDNVVARNLYQSLGFLYQGTIEHTLPGYEHEEHYATLKLAP